MKTAKAITTQKEQILILLAAALVALVFAARADAYPTYGMVVGVSGGAYTDEPCLADLDGYGEWRYDPYSGLDLWFPYVDATWRPYLHGHWIRTDLGLTWIAYEPWGYVPHHYGRWIYVEAMGWGWAPGVEYGPAWVTWSVATGHIGWAPLPPVGYRYPHRYDYRWTVRPVRYDYDGFFLYDASGIAFDLWVFVPERDFYGVSVAVHVVSRDRCDRFFRERRVLPVGHRLDLDYVRVKTKASLEPVRIDRVTYESAGRRYVRRVPRGQDEMIRKAETEVARAITAPARSRESKYRADAPAVRSESTARSAAPPVTVRKETTSRTTVRTTGRSEPTSYATTTRATAERKSSAENRSEVKRSTSASTRPAAPEAKRSERTVRETKSRSNDKASTGTARSRSGGSTKTTGKKKR